MSRTIRPIRIEGNIAFVPLTKGFEAIIDASDAEIVAAFNWHARVDGNTVYAQRSDCSGGKRRLVCLHRLLMGEPDGLQVDHRDANGLNNRRSNLRTATQSQNQHNRRTSANNTSGFKGVSWHKASQKWNARIKLDGKSKHLGLFATAEDAYAAYCEASAEFHGDYGRTA